VAKRVRQGDLLGARRNVGAQGQLHPLPQPSSIGCRGAGSVLIRRRASVQHGVAQGLVPSRPACSPPPSRALSRCRTRTTSAPVTLLGLRPHTRVVRTLPRKKSHTRSQAARYTCTLPPRCSAASLAPASSAPAAARARRWSRAQTPYHVQTPLLWQCLGFRQTRGRGTRAEERQFEVRLG
jgi:hypothetical protein